MKRPTIRILEETTNNRGDLFNRLIEDLFLALGYENVRFNIHKPGREIDIEATHRTERRQVRAECKATKEPVGGSTINKFVGALDAERRLDRNRNREIIGYFISLFGFTETALEQENETGQRIVLLNADQIIQELIKGHILAPIEKVMEQAGRCAAATSGIEVETPPELLAHETGWIWAVYYCSNKQRTHFTLIHADGEVLSRDHSELILQSELSTDGKFKSLQFLAPSPESRPIQQLIAEARKRYFQYLLDECGEIQLEGLPADQEVGIKRLNLENIFVPLYLESQTSISQREPVGNILATQHRLAILGPPGSGKSTLLKRLALAYAFPERRKLVDDHLPEHPWFPLFVRCRQFGNLATQPIREILFSTLRRIELPEDLANALRSFVDGILQNGQALLLIDGLDEISDPSFRASFISQLRTFLATYPVISIILTSREAGFRLISGPLNSICTKYRLADFEEEDIRRLSVAWHREVLGDKPAVNAEAERLVKNICESDRVRALAKNPLLLTTLLLVKRWVGELPHRRSVLYGKAIEVLLMTWNVEAHRPLEQDEAVPQLAFVAFSMMKKGVQQISLKRLKEILLLARQQMPELLAYTKDSVSMFISLVEFRSSILILSGNIIEDGTIYPLYEYRHLTFQEYLAAKAIVDGYYQDRQDGDTLRSVLMPYLYIPEWKEVIHLSIILAGRKAQPLIKHLVQDTYKRKRGSINLLAQCVIDEVQISPDLLKEALECIVVHEQIKGSLTIPILQTKYGGALLQVTQQNYLAGGGNWKRWGDLLGTLVLDKLTPRQMVTKSTSATLKAMLTYGDPTEIVSGLMGVMALAESLKRPFSRPVLYREAKGVLAELVERVIPQLDSQIKIMKLSAFWALASLADTKVLNLSFEVLVKLVDSYSGSSSPEIQHMSEKIIKRVPVNYKEFSEIDARLINYIKGRNTLD